VPVNLSFANLYVNTSIEQKTLFLFYIHPWKFYFYMTSVAYDVGPNVNSLQNNETQHVNIVLQCMYRFFEKPNMKGSHA
jgi:hypothetical protein